MAIDRYFQKFPVITYNSQNAVDITRRVVLLNNALKNPYLFYPYEIDSNERADQFSNRYYNDQYKSWIIYLSNNMLDPYYEWYLDQDVFKNFIEKKYGSLYLAQNKIKHYDCNWEGTEPISISAYNALLPTLTKYWEPDYQNSNKIMTYKRKAIDQIVSTNSIRSYTVANTSFKTDEICSIVFNNTHKGSAQVVSVANTKLYVQHTSGTTLSTNEIPITGSSYIYGHESNVNTHFTTSSLIVDNLLPEEEIYWKPVTYYNYESNNNEYNKTLRILDNVYSKRIADNLTELMKT